MGSRFNISLPISIYLYHLTACLALQAHASSCVDETEELALSLSSFAGYLGTSTGFQSSFLSCHALEVSDQLCLRVNSIPSFMEANRLVNTKFTDVLLIHQLLYF